MTAARVSDPAVIASNVSYEEYLALDTPPPRVEWVAGEVIDMGEITFAHAYLVQWLVRVLGAFVESKSLGVVLFEPFNMKLPGRPSGRCPDIMFIAEARRSLIGEKDLDGPADLVVEVVSPTSGPTDRGIKFYEYEAGGVREYWLLDPQRQRAEFYVLVDGRYQAIEPRDGAYTSAVLSGLDLLVDWFWSLPPVAEVETSLGLR